MKELPDSDAELKEKLPPVPDESVAGWKQIPIIGKPEDLVPLGAFTPFSNCDTSAAYFGERGQGREMNFLEQEVNRDVSLITHYVRKEVLYRLETAQQLLPPNHYFRLLDTYRPLAVQKALFDVQVETLRQQHPDQSDEWLKAEAQKYVSIPAPDPEQGTTHPSPHSTGAVLDLAIINMDDIGAQLLADLERKKTSGELVYPVGEEDKEYLGEVQRWIDNQNFPPEQKRIVEENWLVEYRYFREKARIFKEHSRELNMGTTFDHFGPEAAMSYFEHISEDELTPEQREARNNRRLMYSVMTQAGFANYPEEWWHWSYGDQMWAANLGESEAVYSGVAMTEDNRAFEESRRGVYSALIEASETGKKELFVDAEAADPRAA